MNLKESKEKYIGRFLGRKGKKGVSVIILIIK